VPLQLADHQMPIIGELSTDYQLDSAPHLQPTPTTPDWATCVVPLDEHLRTIELGLQVKIAHRHEQFRIDGPKAKAEPSVGGVASAV
jgi:hypothetical protein